MCVCMCESVYRPTLSAPPPHLPFFSIPLLFCLFTPPLPLPPPFNPIDHACRNFTPPTLVPPRPTTLVLAAPVPLPQPRLFIQRVEKVKKKKRIFKKIKTQQFSARYRKEFFKMSLNFTRNFYKSEETEK